MVSLLLSIEATVVPILLQLKGVLTFLEKYSLIGTLLTTVATTLVSSIVVAYVGLACIVVDYKVPMYVLYWFC
jgi:hypothetical protein